MQRVLSLHDRATRLLGGRFAESIALLFSRVALAGIFWRSYKTKVVEGSWFELSDTTRFLFETDYAGVPLPPALAAPMATYAEFAFPILLVVGLGTRVSAFALLGMALVIQLFVYPTQEHFFGWAIMVIALAAILISRGSGLFSLDAATARAAGR